MHGRQQQRKYKYKEIHVLTRSYHAYMTRKWAVKRNVHVLNLTWSKVFEPTTLDSLWRGIKHEIPKKHWFSVYIDELTWALIPLYLKYFWLYLTQQ